MKTYAELEGEIEQFKSGNLAFKAIIDELRLELSEAKRVEGKMVEALNKIADYLRKLNPNISFASQFALIDFTEMLLVIRDAIALVKRGEEKP